MKTIHLSDVGLSKLTLQRWYEANKSLPGGKQIWSAQKELLERRTKAYTADEINQLLELGRGHYRGFRGANKQAVARLCEHLTRQRNNIVRRAEAKLARLTKRNKAHV